jgi:glycosyltransferase involved in cell wall biosynthesis
LRAGHPDWRCQLLGSLDEDNRTAISQAELDQWVAGGIVEHIGHVEDVRPFIAAATAVVLPSYREGLPRSLLEAAAMAKPLIAADVPAAGRSFGTHQWVLCAARDAPALAQAMEELGTMDSGARDAMGRPAAPGRKRIWRSPVTRDILMRWRNCAHLPIVKR